MKITFILPGLVTIPMGGVKVVHEQANRLAERGHAVTLVYPVRVMGQGLIYDLKKGMVRLVDRIRHTGQELFYVPSPRVNVQVVRNITSRYIPQGDVIIAVGWQTALGVARLPHGHGRPYYLLQSYETYFRNKAAVLATYHLPLQKIAVARWIMDELHGIGEDAAGPLTNAINPAEFYPEPQANGRDYDIIMVYHPARIKGFADALAVWRCLRRDNPRLKGVVVASRPPWRPLPKELQLYIRPPIAQLRRLYNQTRFLLHASYWEGWSLPPMEALACGCAVVSYANRGVCEYLSHGDQAWLAPVGDRSRLGQYCREALNDDQQRQRLAERGRERVLAFNWDQIIGQLEAILRQP